MFSRRMIRLLMVSAALSPLAGHSASAQTYPGEDVIVNLQGIPPAPSRSNERIVLKRPGRHVTHVAKATEPAQPSTPSADLPPSPPVAAETPPPAVTETKHARTKTKHTAPPAEEASTTEQSGNAVPFSLTGEEEPLGAPSTKVAKAEPPPQHAPAQQPPQQSKSDVLEPGLAKRGAILFEHSATDPQPSQLDGIKLLAGDLNSALEAGATQIQLEAFGGSPNDKSSDARRISLKRALAIRQLLIDNGVPASRIVTRAMGGTTDGGQPDRVDIYVRSS
jgi:outer membrane protein OmpA-like peptidoglycan-associated protein